MTTGTRDVVVQPAAPGDVCDVSRCGSSAQYALGFAYDGQEPRAWYPYCAHHGRKHLPASSPLRGLT